MRVNTGKRRRLPRRLRATGTQRGFTMIEVMVSMLVTAIALIGIMAMMMNQSRAMNRSRMTAEATVLAVDAIERMRVTTPTIGFTSSGSLNSLGTVASGNYYRYVEVSQTGTLYSYRITSWFYDGGNWRYWYTRGRR